MEPPKLPQTPPMQRTPSNISVLTPEAQAEIQSLKRKASQLSEPDQNATNFLRAKFISLQYEMDAAKVLSDGLTEAFEKGVTPNRSWYECERAKVLDEEVRLGRELNAVANQGRFFQEDLQDSLERVEDAYVQEMTQAVLRASEDASSDFKKNRVLAGNKFSKLVGGYLAAERTVGANREPERWCVVLGEWIPKSNTKCAHIIPKSLDSKNLAYLFGTDDAALESERNGLILQRSIEKAFDNGWIVIVPDGSVETTPTEWKMIVLNDQIANDTVYTKPNKFWRWKDLDGRKLTFKNANRPARRYLYFRYTIAYIHAQTKQFQDFKAKVPSGRIWASPNKPDGYLRRSVLRSFARRVGDIDLPEDLVDGGGYNDTEPATGTVVKDQVASIAISLVLRQKLQGEKESKDESDDDK